MPVCMQHHVRSSSAGSRLELSSLPSFDLPAHADASESASLLRSMVSPYLCLAGRLPWMLDYAPTASCPVRLAHSLSPQC